MIGVVDYGAGNLQSVVNAVEWLGGNVITVWSENQIKGCSHLILPGVGSFAFGASQLEKLQIVDSLKNHAAIAQKPLLGLCLGMQLLATKGFEFGETDGLNLIEGEVVRLMENDLAFRVPHIGWNEIALVKPSKFAYKDSTARYLYFNHSFHFKPKNPSNVVATVDHGQTVTAIVEHENIIGVQAHPEKSQQYGLTILSQFIKL